jgi:hypothetical protein
LKNQNVTTIAMAASNPPAPSDQLEDYDFRIRSEAAKGAK